MNAHHTTLAKKFPLGKVALNLWECVPRWMRTHLNETGRFAIVCAIVGLLCGLAAVTLHIGIEFTWGKLWSFAQGHSGLSFWLPAILIPAAGGVITGWLIKTKAPTASGSGIPQTKVVYYKDFGIMPIQESLWRFLLGIIYVGTGNALGREGPTVHMCTGIASTVGQLFGLAKSRVLAMIPIGMGAGIAAAFNAPIAAVTFVFEELLGDFSNKALGGMIVALVIAAAVERTIFGTHPLLPMGYLLQTPAGLWSLTCIPLGIAAGLVGHGFSHGLLSLRHAVGLYGKRVPLWARLGLSGLIVGVIGASVYTLCGSNGIYSVGYQTLNDAFAGSFAAKTLALLLVGKFIASIICYAAGGSGGVFSPVLFCGGMLGGLMGVGLESLCGAPSGTVGAMVLLGMGAFVASVIRCPITSIVMIFEMTGQYALVLPLMLGNILSFAIAKRLQAEPIYDALLHQDGIILRRFPSYHGSQEYRNLPVSTIMTFNVICLRDDLTPLENLNILEAREHEAYPTVDAAGKLSGILTHQELLELAQEAPAAPLRESRNHQDHLITVFPDTTIRDTANLLVTSDILQAPVVNPLDPQQLIGIITLHDIARQQSAVDQN